MIANRELFVKALADANSIEVEKYLNKDAFHYDFSDAFERKMNKLIAKNNRINLNTRRKISKALIAALIAIIVLLTGLMSVSASREKVVEFIERVFSTNTQITLSENSAPTPETIETAYTLGYVPDGFKLKQYDADELGVFAIWENEKGEEIVFTQDILSSEFSMDNEHYYETFEVNGFPAYIYGNEYDYHISFTDGEYRYTIKTSVKNKEYLETMSEKIIEKN